MRSAEHVEEISPGIFVVDDGAGRGTVHIDVVEVCKDMGLEPTPEHRLAAELIAVGFVREAAIVGTVRMRRTSAPCPFKSQSKPKGDKHVDVDDDAEAEGAGEG